MAEAFRKSMKTFGERQGSPAGKFVKGVNKISKSRKVRRLNVN